MRIRMDKIKKLYHAAIELIIPLHLLPDGHEIWDENLLIVVVLREQHHRGGGAHSRDLGPVVPTILEYYR